MGGPRMINGKRLPRDIVVVGGSAGGVTPIMELLESLPAGLPAAVAVVVHRHPYHETRLPEVLGRHCRLTVIEPLDGDTVQRGVVYVAPRDQHLIFHDGVVRLDRGPHQHRTRPAIDPLFVSASAAYGPRVVGVLFSGLGADGVSGFLTIKAGGGITLVQRPDAAQFPTMPLRALREDDVDGALSVAALSEAIVALASGAAFTDGARPAPA
jgi:two-component system, chemotaxis family, protein-glutamate methylesterase/glutaminase